MPYLIQFFSLIAFVLVLGLPSCRRDKKVDVYRPDGIVFRHSHDPLNASAIHPQNLDLQDVLDLGAAHPSQVLVESTCTEGDKSYRRQTTWGTKPILVLNLLPTELYPFGPRQLERLSCSFGITLMNDVGSKFHNFEFKDRTFIDNQSHGIYVEQAPISLGKRGYVEWDDPFVLFWSKSPGHSLRLACDGFTLKDRILDQRFIPANFRRGEDEAEIGPSLAINARQSCRVLEAQGDQIFSVSEMFDLFDADAWPPLQNETISLAQPIPDAFYEVSRGEPHAIYDIFLTNTHILARTLRIGKRPTQLHLMAYGPISAPSHSRPMTHLEHFQKISMEDSWSNNAGYYPISVDGAAGAYSGYSDWAQISARVESGVMPFPMNHQDQDYTYYELAPGQKIRLRVTVVRHSRDYLSEECQARGTKIRLAAMVFYPTQKLDLDLLLGSGEYQKMSLPYEPVYLLRGTESYDLGQIQAFGHLDLPNSIDYCPN